MGTAFVTGGSGFLGTNLIKELVSQKWNVIVFHLPNDNLRHINHLDIDFKQGDILDYESLLQAIPVQEDLIIFHVAGDTSMWKKNNSRQNRINIMGTRNVANAALEKKVRKLIFTSSISAFGYHPSRIDEHTQSNAGTCGMNYNKSKYLAEKEIHKAREKGLFAVILNPCNLLGPYDEQGWSTLIQKAHGTKFYPLFSGKGTFAHVKDVARAHIMAAKKGRDGENYLLGGVEVTFKDLAHYIETTLNKRLIKMKIPNGVLYLVMRILELKSVLDGSTPALTYPRYKRLTSHILCDDYKAQKELGFSTTDIEQMIRDSHYWLVAEGFFSGRDFQ